MDGNRFDTLAKGLAAGRTRRSFLKGLAGGAAGLVAAKAGTSLAAATKIDVCHHTGSESNPWEQISVAEASWDAHNAHGGGRLGTDDHCAYCGDTCSGTESCVEGVCVPDSPCSYYSFDTPVCFWMENYTGNYCWVPYELSYDDCQYADSCSETGGGGSGGGCYKWATSTNTTIAPPW